MLRKAHTDHAKSTALRDAVDDKRRMRGGGECCGGCCFQCRRRLRRRLRVAAACVLAFFLVGALEYPAGGPPHSI